MDSMTQRESVGFDSDTKIDPWRHALMRVMDQLDDEDIKKITFLLRDEVDVEMETFLDFSDGAERFQRLLIALEENHDIANIALWLQEALDLLNLHEVTTGTKLSDVFVEYWTQLNNHLQSMNVLRNEVFLGRTDAIKSVKEELENVEKKRNKSDMDAVLHQIVSKNDQVVGQNPEKQVLELLESIKEDAILQDKDSNLEMHKFLKKVTCKMAETDKQCKVKLLLTTRQKLSKKDLNLEEVELGAMSEAEAVDLLKQNMPEDFENGKYANEADRGRHILVHQTMPTSELLEECFKRGLTFIQAPEPMEGQNPDDLGLGPERRHSSVGSEEGSLESSMETTDVTDSMLQRLLQQSASPLGDESQPPQDSSENVKKQHRKKKRTEVEDD